jgi:hypothetical protein
MGAPKAKLSIEEVSAPLTRLAARCGCFQQITDSFAQKKRLPLTKYTFEKGISCHD